MSYTPKSAVIAKVFGGTKDRKADQFRALEYWQKTKDDPEGFGGVSPEVASLICPFSEGVPMTEAFNFLKFSAIDEDQGRVIIAFRTKARADLARKYIGKDIGMYFVGKEIEWAYA